MSNNYLLTLCKEATNVFYSDTPTKNKKEIEDAGIKLLLVIYNKKNVSSLNMLRYKIFMEKICGKSAVKPEHLPPTEDSAKQHFVRAYHQI